MQRRDLSQTTGSRMKCACVRVCMCACVCVVADVPKLEFGEDRKEKKGKRHLFPWGGGLQTNKGRARGPGVVGRSKKVVMHWRRLNLNELNGELKSLGGFSACFPLWRVGRAPRNEKKHNQPTTRHQQPQPNQCQIRETRPCLRFVRFPAAGFPTPFPRQSLGGAAKPNTPSSLRPSDMLSCQ